MSDLYSQLILDHYRRPRNHGALDGYDRSHEDISTVCGDLIRIDLQLDGDTIADIRFDGRGCAISQAATSILTELVKGQPIDAVHAVHAVHAVTDNAVLDLLGVPISPSRQQCALLGLTVLRTTTQDGSS